MMKNISNENNREMKSILMKEIGTLMSLELRLRRMRMTKKTKTAHIRNHQVCVHMMTVKTSRMKNQLAQALVLQPTWEP
jgi:hypothetical protein